MTNGAEKSDVTCCVCRAPESTRSRGVLMFNPAYPEFQKIEFVNAEGSIL